MVTYHLILTFQPTLIIIINNNKITIIIIIIINNFHSFSASAVSPVGVGSSSRRGNSASSSGTSGNSRLDETGQKVREKEEEEGEPIEQRVASRERSYTCMYM